MPRGERLDFVFDSKKPRNESIDVRRQRDQELGLGFWDERGGIRPCRVEVVVKHRILATEALDKERIDALQSVVFVQIEEC